MVVDEIRVGIIPGPGHVPPPLVEALPFRDPVEVVVVIDELVHGQGRVAIADLAVAPHEPGRGRVPVLHIEALAEHLPRIALETSLYVRCAILAHHPMPQVDSRIGVLSVSSVQCQLTLNGQTSPIHQVPVHARHLGGRGQAVVHAHQPRIAVVAHVSRGSGRGQKHRGRAPQLPVVLAIRGHFHAIVIGQGQLDFHLPQIRRLYLLVLQGAQIPAQQDHLGSIRDPGTAPGQSPLHRGQEADLTAAQLLAAGVGEHDVVIEQHGPARSVRRGVIAHPHPEGLERLILVRTQTAAERTSGAELLLGIALVEVDVGQTQERCRGQLELHVAAEEIGEVRPRRRAQRAHDIVAIRLARTREDKGSLPALTRAVQAEAVEERFVESQGRESGVDAIAHHQPKASG